MRRILWTGLTATLIAAATGCGGGGGGGGPTPVQLPAPVAITSANRDAVATATVNVFISAGNAGAVVPLSGGGRATAAAMPGSSLVRIASAATLAAGKAAAEGGRVTVQAVIPIDLGIPCSSGTAVSSLDDRNNNGQPDVGEPITVVFTNCVDGGDLVNGQMTINITSIGAGGLQFTADLGFADLRMTNSDGSATLNGGASLALAVQPSGAASSTLTVGTNGLVSAVVGTAGATGYSETLTLGAGLTVIGNFDPTVPPPAGSSIPGRTLVRVDGAVGSSRLSGSFTISTVTPIEMYEADLYPRGGQVISTGAAGSKLRMTVLNDAATVQLELDANGDGIYDPPVNKLWSEIL